MNYRKLNLIADIYFYLVLLSGFLYLILLVVASQKIIPALIMQVIFLLDALKFSHNIISLIFSKLFLLNVIPGLFLIGLLSQFSQTLIKTLKNISTTKSTISNLDIISSTSEFIKYKSDYPLIFTQGFFRPQIYLSSFLFKTHSLSEIEAMLHHEVNHQRHFHPLKIYLADFVRSILPAIPGKNWLIDNYLTLVEVSSDQFSENQINDKLPLVSALLKFQNQDFKPGISYFNSQSERIRILVGQNKQAVRLPLAYYTSLLIIILSGTLFLNNSQIFFDCHHILDCLQTLTDPNGRSLITSVSIDKNTFFPSDHCQ